MKTSRIVLCIWIAALALAFGVSEAQPPPRTDKEKAAEMRQRDAARDSRLQAKPREYTQQKSPASAAAGSASSANAKSQSKTANGKPSLYRYIGESEKKAIDKTGKIPNTDATGKKKSTFLTGKQYQTSGQAKRQLGLKEKPTYRVEIDPKNVKNRTDMQRVDKDSKHGPSQATTSKPIPVDKEKIVRLKGAPQK
jgi:hypothetical protein